MNTINITMEFNSPADAQKAFDVFIRDLTDNYTADHNIKFNNKKTSTETILTMDEDDIKVFASLIKQNKIYE